MSEIDQIKADIADTKRKLIKAEEDMKSEAYLICLQTTLSKQTGVWENLLAIQQGKFQLLSLHTAHSNRILPHL
jgi:hypothetical protein